MSSIPEEMCHEILLRLPVKSLLVCKSVCKNWYALISSSNFVNAHIAIQKNNPILMLEGSSMSISNHSLYSIGYNSLASPFFEIKDDTIEIDYPFKHLDYDVRLLGTCNGLVCMWLYDYGGGRDFLCLWNPATTEYKEIPKSPNELNRREVCLCAFGYDCKTDDYKLAMGIAAYGTKDSVLVQVYTLTSNSWKNGQIVPYKFPYTQKTGVLVNEYLHWLAKAQGNIILLSLDMGDESFKEMQLPMDKNKDPNMILGELEGCLCILVRSYANGDKLQVEVWKMLDYGVGESWARYYVISPESIIASHLLLGLMWSFFFRLMGSFKNGQILFLSCGMLVSYDPKYGSAREEKIDNFTFLDAGNYIESLVSLNSGTHV